MRWNLCASLALLLACPSPAEAPVVPEGGVLAADVPDTLRLPVPAAPVGWGLANPPLLRLGGAEDAGETFFEIFAATFWKDTAFVVADRGAEGLRVFSLDGTLLRTIGRRGDGPGEFQKPVQLWSHGDSLWVFDERGSRLSLVHWTAGFLDDWTIHGSMKLTGGVGRFASGRWFAFRTPWGGQMVRGALSRDTVPFVLLDEHRSWAREFVRVPGMYTSQVAVDGRRAYRPTPFTPRASHAVWGNCVAVSAGDTPMVEVFDHEGRHVRSYVLELDPRPADDAAMEAWIDFFASNIPAEQRSAYRAVVERIPRLRELPFFADIRADPLGALWLQIYEPPFGDSDTWIILDPAGTVPGRLRTPEPMRILDIGERRILGRIVSGLGVEEVVILELERHAAEGARGIPQCLPLSLPPRS